MANQRSVPLGELPVRERRPVERLVGPFEDFVRLESFSGLILIGVTILALLLANSQYAGVYFSFWETELAVELGQFGVRMDLHHWINDGLMVVFFLLVGLEIKREVMVGELSSLRRAALPIAGAIGGMVAPAVFYWAIAGRAGGPAAAGWGIPMATDIAFAIGVLAILGRRIPDALKVFLVALAIADDIGAVLVIALFYTAEIATPWLLMAVATFIGLMVINWAGIRHPGPYAVLGVVLWYCFLESGVHATVAGILLALTIPAHRRVNSDYFLHRARELLDLFEVAGRPGREVEASMDQQEAVRVLEIGCERAQTPLMRMERGLGPWVTYAVLPVFAFANAGVALGGGAALGATDPVALGIGAGLVVGKPVGIMLAVGVAVAAGIAYVPRGVTARHLLGVSFLAGIGFTMSLFIAGLAFEGTALLDVAKIGILGASLIAGVTGFLLLRPLGPPEPVRP